MRRNATSRAEYGVPAVWASPRGTACPRCAPVARFIADVTEIWTAGALHQVAGHRGLVAYLRARRFQERLGDPRELRAYGGVSGPLRHRGGGADCQALRSRLDAIVEKAREAGQPLRPAHV